MYFPDSSKVSRPDTLWCLSRGFGCIRGNGEHNNTMLCKSENNSFVKLLNKPHPHVQRSGGPPTADVLLSTTVLFHMILKLLLPPFLSLPLWLMAVPFIFSMFHVLLHSLLHVLYVFPIISWRYCMRVLFASQTHSLNCHNRRLSLLDAGSNWRIQTYSLRARRRRTDLSVEYWAPWICNAPAYVRTCTC